MASFSIDRFLNIRSAGGPSFSPDGRFVSFLTNTTGVSQLWQVPVDGGWPRQLSFARDSVRSAAYNPRRPEIVFSKDTGGNERTQLYRLQGVAATDHDLGDGWNYEDISRKPEAVHYLGGWSHDGDQICFSANRDNPSRFDVYVQAVPAKGKPGAPRLVQKGPGGYYVVVGFSADDRQLLVRRIESNFNQDLYVVDVATGKAKQLTPHRDHVQYHGACWSADGNWIFCASTAQNRDLAGLARIEVKSSELSYIEKPDHEVEGAFTSPKGRWLGWLVNNGGRAELKLRNQTSDKTISPPDLPLGIIGGVEFAPDESKLAFSFEGPRYNDDVWIWDLKAGKLRQLTHASRAGIPFSTFVEPELIEYKTFDDKKIPAWWFPPAGPKRDRLPPVIVYPHGGPESQTRPRFSSVFQYFLQAGYAILAPNVRGSSGYGTAYMNLDNVTKRMDSVKDLAHAAYWLRDQKKGDPKRLAVYGGSYGGFMVLAAVTNYPDLWAAGVDVVGIANFVTFLENTGAYRRAHRSAEYGNVETDRAFLEKVSPIHHVDKIKCPMMVIHGANDPRVPVGEAEQIVAALKKRKVPVEYLRYEDEGHGLGKLKNRLDAYPKIVAFLDKFVKK